MISCLIPASSLIYCGQKIRCKLQLYMCAAHCALTTPAAVVVNVSPKAES